MCQHCGVWTLREYLTSTQLWRMISSVIGLPNLGSAKFLQCSLKGFAHLQVSERCGV